MSKLILAGHELDGDLPQLKTFREPPYYDASAECVWYPGYYPGAACAPGGATSPEAKNKGLRRYAYRPSLRRYYHGGKQPPLDAAKASINKFIFHHDGCRDAAMCWRVLHNERGLSAHFLIDGDGTIYQTADLALMTFHAAQYNLSSLGVELNNRGDAKKEPNYYPDRRVLPCKIGGSAILAWDYTDAQYEALSDLARLLNKHLPNLPLDFPQDSAAPGKQYWGVMAPGVDGDSTAVPGFAGYLGHYHCTKRKWDPGAFDFKKFIEKLKRTRVFPMWAGSAPKDDGALPEIPKEQAALEKLAADYYEANERAANGGFYPVGPWGTSRIWHGGVHVPGTENSPVYSPFAGRVVAARQGASTPIGSGNFVLTRHDLNLGGKNLRFWMLAMHLADEAPGKNAPSWMAVPHETVDDVAILDEPVDAGIVIGRVGTVGPPEVNQAQVHLEIFSRTNLFAGDDDWVLYDGTAGGRFCDLPEINALIDTDKDARLSRDELTAYYGGGDTDATRRIVSYNVSEWTEDPPWAESLALARDTDFRKKTPKRKGKQANADDDDEDLDIDAMVAEQLTPFLWWTNAVAAKLGLPADGVVCHYHPIRFIEWVNAKLQSGAGKADEVIDTTKIAAVDTRVLKDDFDDTTGESAYVDTEAPDPDDSKIELEQLLQGYEGETKLFGEGTP